MLLRSSVALSPEMMQFMCKRANHTNQKKVCFRFSGHRLWASFKLKCNVFRPAVGVEDKIFVRYSDFLDLRISFKKVFL